MNRFEVDHTNVFRFEFLHNERRICEFVSRIDAVFANVKTFLMLYHCKGWKFQTKVQNIVKIQKLKTVGYVY